MKYLPVLLCTVAGGVLSGMIGVGTTILVIDMAAGYRVENLFQYPEALSTLRWVFWLGSLSTVGIVLVFYWLETKSKGRSRQVNLERVKTILKGGK